MPRAKTAQENTPKAERKPVEGKDARLLINIYAPDSEAKEVKITIPNIQGCSTWNMRTPEAIAGLIIKALRGRYGNKVG